MRLYNAASCTPVDSNWETSQKLPPKPRSFVPVSSAKTSTVDATSDEVRRVQPSTANGAETRVSETYYYVNERRISPLHKQERKSKAIHNRNKSPHRRELKIESNPAFQYLAIRTSDVARYRENDVDTTLKRHASEGDFKDDGEHLGDKIQKDTTCGIESRKMKPPTEQPRLLKIPPIFGRSDHRTGVFCHDNVAMTKCHAKQQARLANCQDDVQDELKETQDSFATWATTRSMSNQDDCALTLPSLSVAKKERKSSRILNQNACLENKMRSKNSHETEAQNEHACSRATDTDDRIETSPPTYPARLSSSSHASTSPDYVAVLEAGMEEDVLMASGSNATASTGLGEEKDPAGSDNFDFFPLQSFVSVTKKEPSSGARLGVTSTFPSIKGTFARQSYGKMQDLSLEESKADDEAWASFSEETDKYLIDLPTQSNRNDELPFVFDIQRKQSDDDDDACFTALLANNNNGDGGNARKSEDLPYKTHGEARKALATRRPKLLGPLLEAQFSRSYCLRRKHSTKLADESLRGEGIPPISLSSSSAPPKNQSSSILDLYALRPTLNCMEEENNSFLGKEERWWESENKDVLPTSKKIANDDHAEKNRRVPKNSAVSPPTPSKRAIKNRLLEPRRLLECEKVLGVIALPMYDLMTAIDSADSSAGLSEGQILSLQALVPTPVEKAKLFEPPINATLEEGEEFMMQLIGIPQLEKKLEVLMFQIQFPKSIERFCQGLEPKQMRLEQSGLACCSDLTTLLFVSCHFLSHRPGPFPKGLQGNLDLPKA